MLATNAVPDRTSAETTNEAREVHAPSGGALPIDLYETSKAYVLRAMLPGVAAENLAVSCDAHSLVLAALIPAPASPPGTGQPWGRSLFASLISKNVLYLSYLWMLWDAMKQTWHDKVAGTLVLETSGPNKRSEEERRFP